MTNPKNYSIEERMAVAEDRLDRNQGILSELVQTQKVHDGRLEQIHATLINVEATVNQFPRNGALVALRKLAGHADQIVAAIEQSNTPEAQALNRQVLANLPIMLRFVEAAGPLVELVQAEQNRRIFWQEIKRWTRWDKGVGKVIWIGLGAAISYSIANWINHGRGLPWPW